MSKSQRRKPPLARGRPPLAAHNHPQASSRTTQKVISTYHNHQKALRAALLSNDHATAQRVRQQIALAGGLPAYQRASIAGQSAARGGDSSEVLVRWLEECYPTQQASDGEGSHRTVERKLKMLEVGALSCLNACSRSRLLDVERIDLRSQGTGILEQDFLERPLPASDKNDGVGPSDQDRFDIVSLSLVLNCCPDPVQRGEMLRRTRQFLRQPPPTDKRNGADEGDEISALALFPSVFLVLPAPCVNNSRYLTVELLTEIMASLGFALRRQKESAKLVYMLFVWNGELSSPDAHENAIYTKRVLRTGGSRNNFCILIKQPG